jgi:hypothetical protein
MRAISVEIKVTDNIRFDQFEQVFDSTMPGYIREGLEKVTGEAVQNSPVYRGIFRSGIQNSLDQPKPVTFEGHIFSDVANYAAVIEGVDESGNDTKYGRRPGAKFPDVGEIRLYVERVITPPEEKVDEVTFLVGRKIQRDGILAKRPIGNAFDRNKPFINSQIDRGVEEVFKLL